MSESQALSHLSWFQIHPILSQVLAFIILIIIIITISTKIDKRINPQEDLFTTSFTTGITTVVFAVIFIIVTNFTIPPSKQQINALRQSPVSTTSTQTVPLVSAQSAAYSKLDVHNSTFYLDANSSDTTSYRYFVKTANGDYQVKTLSDSYGNVNSNDVYIHQQNNKPSTLVIKHLQYSNKTVRYILSTYSNWSPKWSTYTFNVPENSITKTSDFK